MQTQALWRPGPKADLPPLDFSHDLKRCRHKRCNIFHMPPCGPGSANMRASRAGRPTQEFRSIARASSFCRVRMTSAAPSTPAATHRLQARLVPTRTLASDRPRTSSSLPRSSVSSAISASSVSTIDSTVASARARAAYAIMRPCRDISRYSVLGPYQGAGLGTFSSGMQLCIMRALSAAQCAATPRRLSKYPANARSGGTENG